MIEFDRVSKRFADHDALRDVSVTIDTGEMVFLTGHSGAGKSTFLRLLMLLERASMGTLRVDGRDTARVKGRDVGRYRGDFGIVFQDHQLLYDRSVLDNVALPLEIAGFHPRDIQRRTRAALDKVGLLGRERASPAILSGGEQQMLAIGRAMLAKPKLMMLDEPSLGLSPILVSQLFGLIEDLNREGLSMVLVEQNTNMALATAERGYVLELGAVALSGTATDLLNDSRLEEAYLGG